MSECEVPVSGEAPSAEGRPPGVVRAMWYRTTERRLMRLGMAKTRTMEGWPEHRVSADEERFAFCEKGSQDPFMTIPTGKIRSIWVGVTRASFRFFWRYDPVTAIVLNVETSEGLVAVPIMPTGDNWRTRLRWTDRMTQLAAERLSDASGVPIAGRGR